MSDGGPDYASMAIGAVVVGVVGSGIAFIRSLFVRNLVTAEKAQEEMQKGIREILIELRSMHDEQTRQRSELVALGKEMTTLSGAIKAAHDRIDALVSVPPRSRKR